MSIRRRLIRSLIPAGLRSQLAVWLGRAIHFSGGYSTWSEAVAASSGYEDREILNKVLLATQQVLRGEATFERDSVVFHNIEVHWPMLTALLWAASRSQGRLDVLDYGGSLGSSYFQHKGFLTHLQHLSWSVVEQEHFVKAGRAHVAAAGLRFCATVDECLGQQQPNVLLLSSVLQYIEDPEKVLRQFCATDADILCVARTPVTTAGTNQLLVQHVPASICKSSYPVWALSESWLIGQLADHWRLVTGGTSDEGSFRPRGASEFTFKDMIFERVRR